MKTNCNNIAIRGARSGRFSSAGNLTRASGSGRASKIGIATLLTAAAIGATAFIALPQQMAPLAHYVLAGNRAPECVRTVVFRDESGSMVAFANARATAMQRLVAWSKQPQTLRATDELAIIDFASEGKVAESTTPIRSMESRIPASRSVEPASTSFSAGILAMRSLPVTKCRTSIIALSDGEIAPLTSAAKSELTREGVASVALVLPGDLPVPPVWSTAFPYGVTVEAPADDGNMTANAIATALADSVGQRLVTR